MSANSLGSLFGKLEIAREMVSELFATFIVAERHFPPFWLHLGHLAGVIVPVYIEFMAKSQQSSGFNII